MQKRSIPLLITSIILTFFSSLLLIQFALGFRFWIFSWQTLEIFGINILFVVRITLPMIAGVVGIIVSNKTEKAHICFTLGITMLVLYVVVLIQGGFVQNTANAPLFLTTAIYVYYIIAAYSLKKAQVVNCDGEEEQQKEEQQDVE